MSWLDEVAAVVLLLRDLALILTAVVFWVDYLDRSRRP